MSDSFPSGETTLLSAEERAQQFSQGPPRFSRKVIWITIGTLAVLGIGGAFADSSFNVTQGPKPQVHHSSNAPETLRQFVNLRALADDPAPPVGLVDQQGRAFTLRALRTKAVVLSFLDPLCQDICPIESAEIHDAAHDIASRGAHVAFVFVDANPHLLGAAAAEAGFADTGLSSLGNAYFLSGSLRELDRIWTAYGVTVVDDPSTAQFTHTNVIDIISPSGRLAYSLEPFGNELPTGKYVLPTGEIERFATAIADYVEKVLR